VRSKIRLACLLLAASAALCVACGDDGSWSDLLLSARHSVRGTLTRLDREHNQIVVRNRKGVDVAIETDAGSRIPANASEGAQVSVHYKIRNGRKVALSLKSFATAAPASH